MECSPDPLQGCKAMRTWHLPPSNHALANSGDTTQCPKFEGMKVQKYGMARWLSAPTELCIINAVPGFRKLTLVLHEQICLKKDLKNVL